MELIRAKKVNLSIDLAPLIDVVFQLLIFFMLTSTFANPAIKMTLPMASAHKFSELEKIVIGVDEVGAMYINGQLTSLENLYSDLKKTLVQREEKSIHIKGHKDMPYKLFVQIMDISKQAGAEHINVVHQRVE